MVTEAVDGQRMYGHRGSCTVATAKAQDYEDYESAVTAPLPYEDNVLQETIIYPFVFYSQQSFYDSFRNNLWCARWSMIKGKVCTQCLDVYSSLKRSVTIKGHQLKKPQAGTSLVLRYVLFVL